MKSIALFCGTIVCGVVSDLLSKHIIFERYGESGYTDVISGFVGIICSRNEGIAFGLMPGKGNVLIFLTISVAALIVWIYCRSDKSDVLNTIGLATILAGAAGNLWDRFYFHSVRDFIDVHIGRYHWPTFNVADALICIGVGIVIFGRQNANRKP